MTRLAPELFKFVVRYSPLVSIDLVVRNERRQMLLGLRRNRPAQACWFVPGSRVAKNERIGDAFVRITTDELGISFPLDRGRFLGVFEHVYPDNFSGDPAFGTHYVVLAHELRVAETELALPAEQHSAYRWASDADIVEDDSVHENTKAYARLPL